MSQSPGPGGLDGLAELIALLARRHALPLFWELRGGGRSFAGLARAAGSPEPAASQRLRELREAGLVEVDEAGDYRLTSHGRRLQGVLEALAGFAVGWQRLSPRQRVPRGSTDRGRGEP